MALTQVAGGMLASSGLNASALTTGTLPKAQLPAGTVLQVVQGTYATQTAATTTSQTASGLSATITPTSASSKILVMISDPMRAGTGSVYGIRIKLTRNGAEIFTPMNVWGYSNPTSTGDKSYLASFNYVDSPGSTSATTYAMTFAKSFDVAYTVYAQIDNDPGTIILMEIAA